MNAFTLTGEFLLKGEKSTLSSIDNIDKKASGLGGAFKKAGQVAAVGIAAIGTAAIAIGGAIVGMTKNAVGFEKQMAEVYTLLPGLSKDAMAEMNADVLEFAKNMGTLPNEVIPALYQSISAGVPKENVFEFLETAQKAAIGGVTELETAVDGISSVVNAYGSDIIDATKTSDLMFTAVRLGKTTFEELSASLFQVIPSASALGVSFEDVTAAIATMTAQGTPTSVATTQMRQMLVELSKEGNKTSILFKELAGESFKDFIAEGGNVSTALALMKEHADENNLGLNDLFGSVEAGNAALVLGGKGAETYVKNLEEMQNSLGATDEAFNTMEETGARAWDKIMANFEVMKIELGQEFLPVFKDVLVPLITDTIIPLFGNLLEKIKPIGDKLVELIPILVDKLAPAFLSIVEIIGDSFIGIFDTLIKDVLPPLIELFQIIVKDILPFFVDAFMDVVDNLLPPLIDLFNVIIKDILPVYIDLFKNIISAILPPFIEILKVIIERILPPFMELFTVIIEKVLPPFLDLFLRLVDSILPPLVEFFAMLVETIMPPFIEILELIMEILEPFIDLFAELLEAILPLLLEYFTLLAKTILPPLLEVLKLIIEYAIKPLLNLFGKLIEWALPYIIKAIEYLAQVVIPAIIGMFTNWQEKVQAVKDFFIAFAESFMQIWNGIKDFFIGIWNTVTERINLFKENFLKIWEAIRDGIKVPINAIIRFINKIITGIESMVNAVVRGLNTISIKMPDWLGGKTFGFNLKTVSFNTIPELAKGGFITSPGYALVGEAGPELLRLPQGAQVEPLGSKPAINIEKMNIMSPEPLTESKLRRVLDNFAREMGYRMGLVS